MKDALNALLVSETIALLSTALFSPQTQSLFHWLGVYISHTAFWTVPIALSFIVRNVVYNRRLKLENWRRELENLPAPNPGIIYIPPGHEDCPECAVPDTQPLGRK